MINLVATRQKSGTPAELLRWYNDHVNLLMRFEGLAGATLYRWQPATLPGVLPGLDAPEYVCLYRFASTAAFAAFEASPAKELARQIAASGWGQHGIEIVQRSQYPLGGQWTGGMQRQSTPTSFHIQCLNLSHAREDAKSDTQRWLADSLYHAANAGVIEGGQASVQHFQWLGSDASDNPQQVVVLASLTSPALGWPDWWQQPGSVQTQMWGQAPSAVEIVWQAGYECVCRWQK